MKHVNSKKCTRSSVSYCVIELSQENKIQLQNFTNNLGNLYRSLKDYFKEQFENFNPSEIYIKNRINELEANPSELERKNILRALAEYCAYNYSNKKNLA